MPRQEVMKQMRCGCDNIALLTSRMTKGETFAHVFATRYISEKILLSSKTSNNSFHFPLYLYPSDTPKTTLFEETPTDAPGGRKPNLSPKFIEDCAAKLSMQFIQDGKGDRVRTFGPEDVFNYMYAVFHSPTYRSRYAEFLKMDFPRLPLTSKPELFRELCTLGQQLVDLHLMETKAAKITGYPVAGDNMVEKVRCVENVGATPTARPPFADNKNQGDPMGSPLHNQTCCIYINPTQYFEGIPKEVWEFHIGGYQVCDKWLKDRKGRQLTYDDLTHYQQVVSALAETMKLMESIDTVIDQNGGWPVV